MCDFPCLLGDQGLPLHWAIQPSSSMWITQLSRLCASTVACGMSRTITTEAKKLSHVQLSHVCMGGSGFHDLE